MTCLVLCEYCAALLTAFTLSVSWVSYQLGRWREQLSMLELFKPET
jgi:hypothetical protein